MRKGFLLSCFFAVVLMSSCVRTAYICDITPVYKTSVHKTTINDFEAPTYSELSNDNLKVYQDENVRIAIFHMDTSDHSSMAFAITNLKGGLMSYNAAEATLNNDFVETIPNKSPWIPKDETFVFLLPVSSGEKPERLVLLDETDYYQPSEYERAQINFHSRIEQVKQQKPKSEDEKYFSFVIRFINDEYYWYKVTYSIEGVRYDYKISVKEYRDVYEVYD